MFDNIETDHGGGEGTEAQAVEVRDLDDATVEPRAYVERTGEIAKAEAVQKEFAEVTANLERSANQGAPKDDSGWIGETGEGQWRPGEREVRLEEHRPDVLETSQAARVEAVQTGQDSPEAEGGARAPVLEAPQRLDVGPLPTDAADLPEARAEPGAEGSMPGGAGSPGGPLNLPDVEALIADGGGATVGTGPTYVGNIPGHGGSQFGSRGGLPGGFDGMPDLPGGSGEMPSGGGFGSSGGGMGVRLGGAGAAEGNVTDPVVAAFQAAAEAATAALEVGDLCQAAAERAQKDVAAAYDGSDHTSSWTVQCSTGTTPGDPEIQYIVTPEGIGAPTISRFKQGPDDGNPTPYTGRFGTFGLGQPEKTNDTGRVLPDAGLGGFGGDVWRADIDHTDDTGRFYGGIMSGPIKVYPDSGGARPIDPKRATADVPPAEETGSKVKRRGE